MLDFVDAKERMPEDGVEVEVLRAVGYHSPTGYCRYKIERTTAMQGMFVCDMVSTGHVLLWRPAEFPGPVATVYDYPGLDALFHGDEASKSHLTAYRGGR